MTTTRPSIYQYLAISFLLAVNLQLHAQHYPAGSEGIKAGSLPPPGFTVEDYNSFYYADQMRGFDGALNHDFNTFGYVQAPRLIWMTGWNVLDADYGMAIRVPFEYKHTSGMFPHPPFTPLQTITDNRFGLSDIEVEPIILSWHLKRFDISTGYSFWAPTGDYDKNRLFLFNLGDGYWTHMFTLGVTWYPDAEKTWAISLFNHYEINMAQYSTSVITAGGGTASEDTTLGNIYTLEWAVSKTIAKTVDIGLTGYYQQQVTDTEGPAPNGPTWNGEKIQVAGIGPEIGVTFPKLGLWASLRYDYEFSAMDHPQGHLVNLTVTKSF
jgi:hypothetical protein